MLVNNSSGDNMPISAAPTGLSDAELWFQLVVFYLLVSGILAPLGNALIVYGLVRKRQKFQTHFFVIVGWLSFTRLFLNLQSTVLAIFRILATAEVISFVQPRLICHAITFSFVHESTSEMLLLLIMVIDRVLAIVAVNTYRRISLQQIHLICVAIFFGTKLKLIPSYLALNPNDTSYDLVKCTSLFSSTGDMYNLYTQNIDFSIMVLVLLIYFGLIIYIRRRRPISNSQMSDVEKIALKRQLSIVPVVRNVILFHFVFTFTSKLCLTLASYVGPPHSVRLVAYGGVMWSVDALANVIVVLASSEELRKALPLFLSRLMTRRSSKHNDAVVEELRKSGDGVQLRRKSTSVEGLAEKVEGRNGRQEKSYVSQM